MSFDDDALDRFAPATAWVPDWPDVLDRAGLRRRDRLVTGRRLALVAVLAAALVPLVALGGANDWWFLRSGGAPAPTSAPVVVQEGEWSGHPWRLVAYPSRTDGLCVSVTPRSSAAAGEGGAQVCAPFAGLARTPATKASPALTITYLSGAASRALPAYVAGPVIERAASVRIRLAAGEVLRVPTFAGPAPLDHVRFYATELPAGAAATPGSLTTFLTSVAGLDANGDVVACLAPRTAESGVSPLSDCR